MGKLNVRQIDGMDEIAKQTSKATDDIAAANQNIERILEDKLDTAGGTITGNLTVKGTVNGNMSGKVNGHTINADVPNNHDDKNYSLQFDIPTNNQDVQEAIKNHYLYNAIVWNNNTFDLSKGWYLSFDYAYISNKADDWNHIFAFGTHYDHGGDVPHYSIAYGNHRSSDDHNLAVYNIPDNKFHHYEVNADSTGHTVVSVDGKTISTKNFNYPTSEKGLYFSGGGFQHKLNCWLKNVKLYTKENS